MITSSLIQPCLADAEYFLQQLDPGCDQFDFRFIAEHPECTKPPIRHRASLKAAWPYIERATELGLGVFVTVNETDGAGVKTENITRVRAVFLDLDGVPLEPVYKIPRKPGLVVCTSEGRYHAYWFNPDCPLEDFSSLQTALAQKYGGDPSVTDLPRIMRLPGTVHQKKSPFLTYIKKDEQP